ncbi:NAD(P)/FAD-dependent oxidoreductase [Paracoccus pacificus]|uniref:NAD(P)/FAD-dependent oxidoreductase n=1 Tax=Paracoccus pacificus TaxID=1463598 RepID=A0ABW4R373_9RHOB
MAGTVIIGAGQAAASMAARLRALGDTRPITVIGAEPVAPYQRPPLSKAYLLGDMALDRLLLRGADFWADQDITLCLGRTVTGIDRAGRQVLTDDGAALGYDALALTTGAVPRRLPAAIGGDLGGVFTVRTLADVDTMAPDMRAGRRLAVIGGGYIGLEAAAVGRKLGMEVTLIEAAPRILGRVASAETADMIRRLHVAQGVRIVEGAAVDRLIGTERAEGVRLADGREIPADLIVVGIGIDPDVALARDAGLNIDNGIAVDGTGRTSDPAIWAAGDCASFPHDGRRLRLESVGNAIDMGDLIAANMLGAEKPYQPKPWFWSDQFDAKLQIAGLNAGFDQVVRRPGDGEHGGSVWYWRDGRLIAVDALNDARAYMVGKRLIDAGRNAAPDLVGDPATDLKTLLK